MDQTTSPKPNSAALPRPRSPAPDPTLAELFERYQEFVAMLVKERRGRDYPALDMVCYDFEEFLDWWPSLDADFQDLLRKDFVKGYKAAFDDGVAQVQAVVAQYKQPA